MSQGHKPTLFVVSDGRGETSQQVLAAALVQFADQEFALERRAEIRTPDQVEEVVRDAAAHNAAVFYTLVSAETRRAMKSFSELLLVPAVDVLGPAFSALHDLFHSEPAAKPGLYYASEKERFDRDAAIDYTLKHDDGQRPHELNGADVVLVGLSRTSKSTTCFYLAYKGIKAANVPLLGGEPPLAQLQAVDSTKVIGLHMNVSRLMTVREARAVHLGLQHTAYYVDKREIGREVLHAKHLMNLHGWRHFDASYMAIEEIAREVMRLRGFPRRPDTPD